MSSLRIRIIISMSVIICLIIAGSYFAIQDIQVGIIEGEFRNEGFLLANNLASEITNNFVLNNTDGMKKSVDNVKNSYPEIAYIFITNSKGTLVAHTFQNGFPEVLLNLTQHVDVRTEEVVNTQDGIIHEFDAPLFNNIGYVHIGLSENRVNAQILDASRKLLLLAVSAMILGGVFVYFIGKRLTEPVLELSEGVKRIKNGILNQKIEVRSDDEISELAHTFNEMASSLSQKIEELVASKKRTEDAEKYLETLFNSIDDGIIVTNKDFEIVKTNSSFLEMSGLEEKDVLGKTCLDLTFRLCENHDQFNTLLQQKKPLHFVHETLFNGKIATLDMNASSFLDTNGNSNIIIVTRDITQQKILEDEILQRNHELTILNDISRSINEVFDTDIILSKTLESVFALTNMDSGHAYIVDENTGEFLLRINRGAGICSTKFDPGKIRETLVVEEAKVNAEECVSLAVIPLRSKDKVLGMIAISSNKAHAFSNRDKRLFSAIGNQIGVAIENISFYENIKYLKEFNDEILNNVNLAIHVIDRNLRILAVNDELIKFSRGNLKRNDFVNRNLFELFPFLKEKNVELEYEHVINSGEILQTEEKTQYYDEIVYTNTSKIPVKDKNGVVERIITVIKDVSPQKKLEEELKDSYVEMKLTYSKLQELYKMKDNFISNISHELRTPLTSVIGYTELMLDENLTEQQRHKTEIIFRNSKRLYRLIRALLDTQLIESNNLNITKEEVVLNDLIRLVVEDVKNMATTKNLPISIDMPDHLVIQADAERLTQVFTNIVENAVKFTITGKINIKGDVQDGKAHIMISDTGIGIPEDKLEKIFDRFYQVDSSNRRKYGGTGLGLWISKNIIEAHGGKIWAESKNRGSTFHILLPKPVKR